ncbi:MAG: hypothetical protein IJP91_07235 [Synergistaceae bacterium]|nr:hypothetical protein [Synergistaceae bacterium]
MKQTAILVDKKVAGIIRWLERLKKSYSSGAMESALMDAECARADLETLRLDVWATLDPEAKPGNRIFSRLMSFSRVASLAVLIVLLAVFPISRDVKAPAAEPLNKAVTLAEPIIVIREERAKAKSDIEEVRAVRPKKPVKTASVRKTPPTAPERVQAAEPKPEQKAVAYDKVFSLMQTGQRALKNNSSIIVRSEE